MIRLQWTATIKQIAPNHRPHGSSSPVSDAANAARWQQWRQQQQRRTAFILLGEVQLHVWIIRTSSSGAVRQPIRSSGWNHPSDHRSSTRDASIVASAASSLGLQPSGIWINRTGQWLRSECTEQPAKTRAWSVRTHARRCQPLKHSLYRVQHALSLSTRHDLTTG